ncbi:hypothetical protein [Flavobacterium subsaxonicum]|uniref:Uncharacterized protein n=1 Tax=Flavobacterium subsaxonicum WB 4.1-42 = DSM 21790 TaxID=1121898 RepID=A0A0A2MXJ0_9FLAO|nr:hypothetical protein [Flavobacterium subsaxonicum]KGO92940.1 hypothetical protein Q766_09920 [Flavobacterium subsaxonicum WB 4.1-42 = DSM 21790]
MKSKVVYIAFLFIFIFGTTTVTAQMMDRSVGASQYKRPKNKKGKPKDFVDVTVDYYTKELSLDDFQVAAVREVLEEQKYAINTLDADQNMTMAEKKDKANIINEKIDSGIKPLLSAEQLKKYLAIQEKRKKSQS